MAKSVLDVLIDVYRKKPNDRSVALEDVIQYYDELSPADFSKLLGWPAVAVDLFRYSMEKLKRLSPSIQIPDLWRYTSTAYEPPKFMPLTIYRQRKDDGGVDAIGLPDSGAGAVFLDKKKGDEIEADWKRRGNKKPFFDTTPEKNILFEGVVKGAQKVTCGYRREMVAYTASGMAFTLRDVYLVEGATDELLIGATTIISQTMRQRMEKNLVTIRPTGPIPLEKLNERNKKYPLTKKKDRFEVEVYPKAQAEREASLLRRCQARYRWPANAEELAALKTSCFGEGVAAVRGNALTLTEKREEKLAAQMAMERAQSPLLPYPGRNERQCQLYQWPLVDSRFSSSAHSPMPLTGANNSFMKHTINGNKEMPSIHMRQWERDRLLRPDRSLATDGRDYRRQSSDSYGERPLNERREPLPFSGGRDGDNYGNNSGYNPYNGGQHGCTNAVNPTLMGRGHSSDYANTASASDGQICLSTDSWRPMPISQHPPPFSSPLPSLFDTSLGAPSSISNNALNANGGGTLCQASFLPQSPNLSASSSWRYHQNLAPLGGQFQHHQHQPPQFRSFRSACPPPPSTVITGGHHYHQ